MELKQNTAKTVTILAVDSTDHVTAKTGLTLTLATSKSGGAFAAITPTVTELSYGWYAVQLTAAHADTLGDLVLHITNAATEGERLFNVVANLEADTYARLGAPTGASVAADIATVTTETTSHPTLAEIEASTILAKQATVAAIPTNPLLVSDVRLNTLDAAISSRLATSGYTAPDNAGVTAIKAKTDLITTAPATQASVDALFTTALTESYAADGSPATPAQALYMILQLLAEKSLNGTTMTVKKLDGATTAMTFTMNSATAPTSITRSA